MRIAEVDRSGFIRAQKLGKLTGADNIKIEQFTQFITSDPVSLNAGSGTSLAMNYETPSGYMFAGIYRVESNHPVACSIGRFWRSNPQCLVTVTNRSSTNLTDLTVSIGVCFKRLVVS